MYKIWEFYDKELGFICDGSNLGSLFRFLKFFGYYDDIHHLCWCYLSFRPGCRCTKFFTSKGDYLRFYYHDHEKIEIPFE